jgi:tripartite-type tricarboxylate transporter receptor subunit TctC
MTIPRRQFLHLAAGAAALPAVSRIAGAQTYPTRPVTVVVPFAAGGGTDLLARLTAQKLERRLGKPFLPSSSLPTSRSKRRKRMP